jgi:hypothetical protein
VIPCGLPQGSSLNFAYSIWKKPAGMGSCPLSHVKLLEQENILVSIAPEEVLHRYEKIIAKSIRDDKKDPEFLNLCEQSGLAERWTLALAKVSKDIRDKL